MISTPSACIVADKEKVAKAVLMPGDPLRAKYIAEKYLENPELFNTVRNMYGYTGTYKGKLISVMGSGMGIPSMTLYAHELYNFFDVDSIIRVGSAGALREDMTDPFIDMWKSFFHHIEIAERKNPSCQRTHLPIWYRKHATEFLD